MTGAELRALRLAAGLSLGQLAQAIDRDRGHLSRVERGERDATPALVDAYRTAISGLTVEDVRRRDLLAAGAALPVLAVTDAPRRVGAAEVTAVRSLALDLDLTHPLAVYAAQSALSQASAMLHAQMTPTTRASMRAAVALLADRVGWGMLETGQDPTNTLSYAQRLAEVAEPELRAHALLDLAVATPDPWTALATLQHALAGPVAGAERVNLHAVAARVAAPIDPRVARDHLARALDTEPTPSTADWAQQITSSGGHLDAIVGFACHATDHPDALVRLQSALYHIGSHRRRTRARCHVRMASLAVRAGGRDQAMGHVEIARQQRSELVRRDLGALASEARALGAHELAALASR